MPNYNLINDKLLTVQIEGEQVYSKRGAMIAYKGSVHFTRSLLTGGSLQDYGIRSVTGEGLSFMCAQGTGIVFYAHHGFHVTIILLQGETFYVESDSLLAFDSRLRAGTMFMGNQGLISGVIKGAMTDQGLFTTTLEGNGELAIISKGNTFGLEVTPNKPIFVDPDAYIAHKGQLSSNLVTDVNWKTLIGKTSGESYQLKFTGNGTVYIQPSERQQQ